MNWTTFFTYLGIAVILYYATLIFLDRISGRRTSNLQSDTKYSVEDLEEEIKNVDNIEVNEEVVDFKKKDH